MSSCPKCGSQLNYVDQYKQWYCYNCQQYQQPQLGAQSPLPPPPGQVQPKAQQQFQKTSTYQQPQQQIPEKPKPSAVGTAMAIIMVLVITAALFYVVMMETGDPAGTITTELRAPAYGMYTIDFETGEVGNYEVINDIDMWFDNNHNFHTPDFSRGLITDIGAISGLSAITDIPTSGWVKTCAAVVGHGYVVETIDRNVDPTITTEHFYRVYVDHYITSATTGGVMGFTIKWASLSLGSAVNELLTVVVTAPAGVQTGYITISYTLTDETSDTCTILVEYSIDGGTTWNNAEPGTDGDGTTNLASSPTGTSHMYVWDSVADNVATTSVEHDVRIRITPSDTAQGTAGETSDFTVDNFSWETRADMPTPRDGLTSEVVNGKIYVIGGTGGGNTIEEYDPATDTWRTSQSAELTPMPTARTDLTSSVVNGKIYVIGGGSTIEEYDPATDTWRTGLTPMPTARSGLTSSVVNGKIYVFGGQNSPFSTPLDTIEEYDPATDTWRTSQSAELTPIPTPSEGLTSEVVNGKIYVIGGGNSYYSTPLNTIEEYDPATDTWRSSKWVQLTPMPTGRFCLTSSVVDGKIYVIGGRTSTDPINTIEEYDPATDTWRTSQSAELTPMPTAREDLTSGVVNGNIYVIGGSGTRANEVYTPPTS